MLHMFFIYICITIPKDISITGLQVYLFYLLLNLGCKNSYEFVT